MDGKCTPHIDSITPNSGGGSGQNMVINGTCLATTEYVHFEPAQGGEKTSVSPMTHNDTKITTVIPALPAGHYDVWVELQDGTPSNKVRIPMG
ncbi:IPT/TIG domain-containing protein [Actinosynnema sp. NPDC023587]|uniref:IPT/TIG domain-containing protein n=1 Tax=Actinosynnema sp. NPDC023587 TaxID=3154695 RepID=UPI0033D676F7